MSKQYDEEFKESVVKYCEENSELSLKKCSENLGIASSTFVSWGKKVEDNNGKVPTR